MINVGSALSDRAIPLQGIYCGAKHALKAFTDTLRMELEDEGAPISVTLVKPASIDTPFFEKARTYLGVEPQPVPPVYAPEVVAGVILHAAQHPLRELIAGGSGAKLSAARFAPGSPTSGAVDVRGAEDRHSGAAGTPRQPLRPGRCRWGRTRPELDGPYARFERLYESDAAAGGCAAGIAAATVALAGAAWRFRGSMSRRSKAKLEQKPAGNPSELGFGVS